MCVVVKEWCSYTVLLVGGCGPGSGKRKACKNWYVYVTVAIVGIWIQLYLFHTPARLHPLVAGKKKSLPFLA